MVRAPRQRRRLALTVQYATTDDGLPARPLLRRWVLAALERDAELTLRFVDGSEGAALNRSYRGKAGPTNVLSFVYDDKGDADGATGGTLSGDIVLCVPVIRAEASSQGKTLTAHCAHLVVHGVLHLQAYDHMNETDATRMEAREVEILARLGFADPYVAPGGRGPRVAKRLAR